MEDVDAALEEEAKDRWRQEIEDLYKAAGARAKSAYNLVVARRRALWETFKGNDLQNPGEESHKFAKAPVQWKPTEAVALNGKLVTDIVSVHTAERAKLAKIWCAKEISGMSRKLPSKILALLRCFSAGEIRTFAKKF